MSILSKINKFGGTLLFKSPNTLTYSVFNYFTQRTTERDCGTRLGSGLFLWLTREWGVGSALLAAGGAARCAQHSAAD